MHSVFKRKKLNKKIINKDFRMMFWAQDTNKIMAIWHTVMANEANCLKEALNFGK